MKSVNHLLPFGLYRVAGESMQPTYREGDLVLGCRWYQPKAGQVVVASVMGRIVIKRLKQIRNNQIWLEGDNSDRSHDSRNYGWLDRAIIEAVICCRVARA